MSADVPDHVFAALERAEPELVERLGAQGVVRVEYVVGFVHPYSIAVWLVTETDAARDRLPGPDPFLSTVQSVISDAGLPSADATVDATVAQSEETVKRDYEGSWFYALR